jgi:flagellar hook-length control protein FliK
MTDNVTAINSNMRAAPAMAAGVPQAGPSPGLDFADVLASIIQPGRPAEEQPTVKDNGGSSEAADETAKAEPDEGAVKIKRNAPDGEDEGVLRWDGEIQAACPGEVACAPAQTLPQDSSRVAAPEEALPEADSKPQTVPLDFKGPKNVTGKTEETRMSAPETTPVERVSAPAADKVELAAAKNAEPAAARPAQTLAQTPAAVFSQPETAQPVSSAAASDVKADVKVVDVRANVAVDYSAAVAAPVPTGREASTDAGRDGSSWTPKGGEQNQDARISSGSADAARGGTGTSFEKMVSAKSEAGASQRAMIERILEFTQNRGPKQVAHIRMTLSPANLGVLRLDLRVKDGSLSVTCQADSPAAKSALLGGLENLKNALADEGMRLGSFSVSVQSNGREDGWNRDENGRRMESGDWLMEAVPAARTETAYAAAASPGLVDVTA